MATINGVDSLIINSIKSKTEKQVVIETREIKITGDKQDEDKENHHREYSPEDLEDAVEKANKLLQKSGAALCLQIKKTSGENRILLVNMNSKNVVSELSPVKVFQLIKRFDSYKGLAVDRLT
jgi:uncharacterized FlaG/YvyC family protein